MNIQKILFSLMLVGALNHGLFAAAEQDAAEQAERNIKATKDAFLELVINSKIKEVKKILSTINAELLNAKDDDFGITALHIAVENNDLEMVKLLLTQHEKIDFLIKTNDGKTAFDIAKEKGHVAIGSELLKYDVTQSLADLEKYLDPQIVEDHSSAVEKPSTVEKPSNCTIL